MSFVKGETWPQRARNKPSMAKPMGLRVQGSMFKVQGGDGALNVEPVTLNRAEAMSSLFQVCPSPMPFLSVNCGIRVEPLTCFSSALLWRR
jgi:hypothetical protein